MLSSFMDGGAVNIDINLGTSRLKQDVAEAKRQIRDLDKQIKGIEDIRGRVLGLGPQGQAAFRRSFYAQDLQNLQAQRAALVGIVDQEKRATQEARERARLFGVLGGGGRLGTVGRLGIAGFAANRIGANLAQLGDEGQPNFAARAGGLVQGITSFDFVGAVKAAGAETKVTDEQIQKLGADLSISSDKAREFARSLDVIGQSDAAEKLREIRKEAEALAAVEFATRSINTAVVGGVSFVQPRGVRPDDVGGFQGVGGIAAFQRLRDLGVIPAPPGPDTHGFGLTPRLKTALSAAEATGTDQQFLAQLQRAQKFLLGQIQGGGLKTPEAKQAVFGQLAGVNAQIKALTPTATSDAASIRELKLENARARAELTERKDDDIETVQAQIDYYKSLVASSKGLAKEQARAKQIAKQQELQNLKAANEPTLSFQHINPAALGALGQGPFLTSPVAQFAQSFGFKPKAKDFLRDIRSQAAAGAKFQQQLETLRKRGLSESVIGEFARMGLAAADEVAALAKAGPGLIREFNVAAGKREQITERMAVTATSVELKTPSVVIRADRVVGVDRNGNGALDPRERFTTTAAGR